jgi:glycosyltransferase involved in cell wall biosynthesis
MYVVTYTPHGLVPDARGFAPALAAQYLARHLLLFRNTHVCAQESHPLAYETDPEHGAIWRLKEGRVYRRLFRKMTHIDPWPLHDRLARLLRGMRVDLLHAHQLEFPVDDFRRQFGRALPIVLHVHAMRSFDPALGMADAYIAVSGFTRDALVKKGFPADRVHVVHNGADTDRFAPASPADFGRLRTLLGFEEKRVIAYVGRKEEQKGYFDFLEVLETLALDRPDIRGIAVGALPPGAENQRAFPSALERARRLVARGVLLDLPPLPHASLSRVFQVADVLLFPTRFSGEQHPMVLIEALSTGCVVVTTPIAGIPETVGAGAAVLLPQNTGIADLVQATLDVLEHPDRYAAMRRQARELAVSRYDWRQKSLQLERIYFSCLARSHG